MCSFVYSEVDIVSEGYGIMLPDFDVNIKQHIQYELRRFGIASWIDG